jgi:thymidine kinase
MSKGKIVIYTGPMFSGKTTRLVNDLERAYIANKAGVEIGYAGFKPIIDKRYSDFEYRGEFYVGKMDTHSGNNIECYGVERFEEVYRIVKLLDEKKEIKRIGIDELNLFPDDWRIIRDVAEELAYGEGKEIIIACLDMDFRGEPFKPTPEILAIADEVHKCKAVCMKCGGDATRSQRLELKEIKDGKPVYVPSHYNAELIVVGAGLPKEAKEFPKNIYEARCASHHEVPGKRRYFGRK